MRYGAVAALAAQFPPLETAHPDGFLCLGGDLRPERLLAAYSRGIFPWYEEGLPVLWWSPDPRCVLPLEAFHLPRRSARTLRRRPFALTLDRAFGRVIRSCAAPRAAAPGTWIIPEMFAAYERLHALGYAHSVEAWRDGALAGGLYGVALGRAFFGESMFHTEAEASRAALAGLVALLRQRGAILLDCQQETPHIMGMGGVLLPRRRFVARLREALGERREAAPPFSALSAAAPDTAAMPWAPWRTSYVFDAAAGVWLPESSEQGGPVSR